MSVGGSATNSGIDYQQRVSAFFILSMVLDLNYSFILENFREEEICQVSFETSDAIDDICLKHKSSRTYIQAKRKLSFSRRPDSEFGKIIEQFVLQNYGVQNDGDRYVLITSSNTSKKILSDIRKITKLVRMGASVEEFGLLSVSEENITDALFEIIIIMHKKYSLQVPTSEKIRKLIGKIYIICMDLEDGGVLEKSFLVSISCKLSVRPDLIWNFIIAKSLDWAKNRMTINRQTINNLLDAYIEDEKSRDGNNDAEHFFKVKFDPENYDICAGRESLS